MLTGLTPVIVVAMSGGVDSSVAMCLLREREGGPRSARLVGASLNLLEGCSSFQDTLPNAGAICRELDIPFYLIPMEEDFRRIVIEDFITTYLQGRTPNPCVICNQRIKFDMFDGEMQSRLRRDGALDVGQTPLLATGHYARVERIGGGWGILKGRDPEKDQSYMLYRLPRELLPRLEFPLGGLTKDEVVELARAWGLPNVHARESQDVCFLQGRYGDFLVQRTGRGDLYDGGEIVDTRGRIVGRHRGYVHYTVGQRRGLGLDNGPWYVSGVDAAKNRVYVGRKRDVLKRRLTVSRLNWLVDAPHSHFPCGVELRYQSREVPCRVYPDGPDLLTVALKKGAVVTPGQSAVFYDGDQVLGGGIID